MSAAPPEPPELPEWLAPLVPFERRCVEVGGEVMHVMEVGAGTPVVMLHGNPTWGFLYRKVAAALGSEPVRVVLPDLVGLGFSSRPAAQAHTLEAHARWFTQLTDALGLDDYVFVGQDWGGPIGLRALADAPERCRGLVLLNTVVGPPKPGFRPTFFHRFSRWPGLSELAFRGLGFPQVALHLAQGDRESIRGRVADAYRYPLRRLKDRAAPLALARMVPDRLGHPSVPDLERCQTMCESFEGPAAIVWGRRDPVLGRLERRVSRALPRAPVVATEAGHFLQEEVPQTIAAAVREVVERAGT